MPDSVTPASPSMVAPTTGLQRIVVGTDFSDAARIAIDAAVDLAKAQGAELTIVHAVDPMIAALEISPQVIIDDTRGALAGMVESLKRQGVNVVSQLRLGKSWWTINQAARELQADLVVLSSHGRSGLAKMAMGSTADRVLRSCGVPVLMMPIHRGANVTAAPSQWKRGIVGIDFSEESLLAANMAVRLLSRSNAEQASLTLFHTVALTIEFRGPDMPVALPQHWEQAEAASKGQLEDVAAQFRTPNIHVQSTTYRGYASDGILHEARKANADFIALGTHGRGAVNRMLLGSVAERVLHHAECPVLTVRHPDAQAPISSDPPAGTAGQFRG